jgi:hypothetical protein
MKMSAQFANTAEILPALRYFFCFDCAAAIQRLVWIRERERRAAELPLAMSKSEGNGHRTNRG